MILSRYLDTDGDGTGTKNAIGDYTTATSFFIKPPTNKVYFISRMLVTIVDAGSFDSGNYGNGVSLTNGIKLQLSNSTDVLVDLMDGLNVITNVDWGRECYDFEPSNFGAGDEYGVARWTFSKDTGGSLLRLDGREDEKLEIILHDDFTDLKGHYFKVRGRSENYDSAYEIKNR